MTHTDRSHELTKETNASDLRSGTFVAKQAEMLSDMESVIDEDAAARLWQALTERWAQMSSDDQQDAEQQPEEKFVAEQEHQVFKSAEAMRKYYQRLQHSATLFALVKKVPAGVPSATPDLKFSDTVVPHPEPVAKENTDSVDVEEHEITRIQSLMEQLSTPQWRKLSEMTRQLLDSMVVQMYGRDGIDNLNNRAVAAEMILGQANDIGKTYYDWLMETIGTEIKKRVREKIDPERVAETTKLLLLQEVDADLNA